MQSRTERMRKLATLLRQLGCSTIPNNPIGLEGVSSKCELALEFANAVWKHQGDPRLADAEQLVERLADHVASATTLKKCLEVYRSRDSKADPDPNDPVGFILRLQYERLAALKPPTNRLETLLTEAGQHRSNSDDELLALAESIVFRLNEPGAALQTLRALAAIQPDNWGIQILLRLHSEELPNPVEQISNYAYLRLSSLMFHAKGDTQSAVEAMSRVYQDEPGTFDAFCWLADMSMRLKRFKEATELFERDIFTDQASAGWIQRYLDLLVLTQNWGSIAKSAELMVRKLPRSPSNTAEIAHALYLASRFSESEFQFNSISKFGGLDQRVLYLIFCYRVETNQKEMALELLDYLEIPNTAFAMNAVRLSNCLHRLGKPELAIHQSANSNASQYPGTHDSLFGKTLDSSLGPAKLNLQANFPTSCKLVKSFNNLLPHPGYSGITDIHFQDTEFRGPLTCTCAEAYLLEAFVTIAKPQTIVEVGSYIGWSSAHIASPSKNPIVCIDPFLDDEHPLSTPEHSVRSRFLSNMNAAGLDHKFKLISESTPSAYDRPDFPPSVDFAFIDGWHQAGQPSKDVIGILPKLSSGAVIALHDLWIPDVRDALVLLLAQGWQAAICNTANHLCFAWKQDSPAWLASFDEIRRLDKVTLVAAEQYRGALGLTRASLDQSVKNHPNSQFHPDRFIHLD
ncbi:class I SAM-dependent methyltransferase [Pelagicoccus sp. SDUM812002]|uniref:class I SAM-dependent methyltransferase n=1 Tax=Pelagicoccus sp. SDUM812002 TaxID=3041266 RepID=UPI00280F1C88|nr:class I SAM-dependent methyltransferase [Pelagicoccus sp. SDUM812002]MDQ8186435.1 class I SAM-dependent methyltransferase [Pelagicoccus sp. SDUM812002]